MQFDECYSLYFVYLLMSDFKISENKTGTLFYSRPVEAYNRPYRVRFKSFQLGLF